MTFGFVINHGPRPNSPDIMNNSSDTGRESLRNNLRHLYGAVSYTHLPKDKNIEYSKQEIELQEEKNTLLPENENNKNQEDIKHVGIEDNGEKKTQITKKTEELSKKTEELLAKNKESLKEDLNNKIDDGCKRLEETIKRCGEETKESVKETREESIIDNKPETEEVPKDKNTEQVSPKPKDNGIKKQIIKKMEERRMIHPKKVRIMREILEMTRSGLVNFINHPIINQRTMINSKKYKKNFMKMFEVTLYATERKNFTKRVIRLNTPRKGIPINRSMTPTVIEIPGTNLGSKPDDKAMDPKGNTIRRATKRKWQRQSTGRELTETELVPNTTTDSKVNEDLVAAKWKKKNLSLIHISGRRRNELP